MDPTDSDAIVQYSDGCVQESIDRRSTYDDKSRRNHNLYLGNHFLDLAPNEKERLIYNRIRSVVIAHAAVQNGTRAKVSITGRESGEKPVCYLNTKVNVRMPVQPLPGSATPPPPSPIADLLRQIRPECIKSGRAPDGSVVWPQALNDDEAELVRSAIEQGESIAEQAAAMGQPAPPVIPPELLVEINDHTAAEALQSVFDSKWEACNADFFVLENSLLNAINGWECMLYEFDDDTKKHMLRNTEFPQIHLDTTRTDISTCQFAIFDEDQTGDEAIAKYPDLAEKIRENAQEGRIIPAGAITYQRAGIYEDAFFRRDMVEVRTMWVRNQLYPMSPEEAVAKGKVVAMQVPDVKPMGLLRRVAGAVVGGVRKLFKMNGDTAPTIPDPSDEDAGKGDFDEAGETVDAGGEGSGAEDQSGLAGGDEGGEGAGSAGGEDGVAGQEDAGEGAGPSGSSGLNSEVGAVAGGDVDGGGGGASNPNPVAAPQPMRTAYFLVLNGQPTQTEVKPWGKGWPTRPGIRQIRIIAGTTVEDAECEFTNIPLPHNVNFPVAHRPWGQGTPEDLEGIQIAVDKILTDLVEHHDYNTFATQVIPESVNNKRPEFARDKYIKAGEALIVQDDIIKATAGKLAFNLPPPPMPTDAWKFLSQLLDLLDKQGEMAQVLQGQVAAGTSGEAFGRMTEAAQTSILFRSKRAEFMIQYLADLMIGSILNRQTPEDLAAEERKYPIQVWYALHEWMLTNLKYDVSVAVTSGGGASKNTKTSQMMQAAQQGAQISPQTLLERLDLDPDVELDQIAQWQRKMATQVPQPAKQPQPARGAA